MKISIPKERQAGETRVAGSPEIVKKLIALGFDVTVEKGAGSTASFSDDAYKAAGASIAKSEADALKSADIVLKVQRPMTSGANSEAQMMKKGAILISSLGALANPKDMDALAAAGVTSFAMELMPRITRAQSMDILSSQSNLAGYKSVLDAAAVFGRAFPMMMTAAGTVAPAKVMIMGVGVAGLQAIATAKRLGAVVSATDVRPSTKEQVESLGGKFVMVESEETADAETSGGYAKEMSDDYKAKQAALIAETIAKQDVVITTALIPGRPAPKLISEDMLKTMKPGSVIVDLAVEMGGNCALAEAGKIVEAHGVKIVGHQNVPSRLATDTSALYARNLMHYISPLVKDGALDIDFEDEIIAQSLVTKDGAIVNARLTEGS